MRARADRADGFSRWRGELGAAQAAEVSGPRVIISNAATYSLQEVADGTEQRHWFQLYPLGNNRRHMREMLQRAEAAGYHALFVTVDVPVYGRIWCPVGVVRCVAFCRLGVGVAMPRASPYRIDLSAEEREAWS